MSKRQVTIECHDCAEETIVILTEDENAESIKYCPRCGSDNIEVS